MDASPSPTVYVNNLYEKLCKEDLKKCIHALFGQFGKILDVVCLKTYRLRGQAWVVFTDKAAAENAVRTMQGFPFFDKPIKLTFAKTKSDAIAKIDGSFKAAKGERSKKNAAARDALMKKSQDRAAGISPAMPRAVPAQPDMTAPPNKILFVQDLPEATNEQMLAMLFQQYAGFKEFESEAQSAGGLAGLQGFKITPTHAMAISFAKA
eukprot:gene10287-8209_t